MQDSINNNDNLLILDENISDDDIIINKNIVDEVEELNITNEENIIETIVKKLKNDVYVDLIYEFDKILDSAHEYGANMEAIYNEPNEYTTSYYETIALALNDLNEEIKDINLEHIISLSIPRCFYDDMMKHSSRCDCVKKNYDQFISKINKNIIITII
jgi:hypothetical protein